MGGEPPLEIMAYSPFMLSEEFVEFFRSNILLYNERQRHFAETLKEYVNTSSGWSLDFSTGTLMFGEGEFEIKNIQVLGSFSNVTRTWLWSWSNPDSFPEEVLEDARDAKIHGERINIPEFSESQHIPMNKRSALALAMTAVDIVGAEAFYPADINNGDGIAFISLRDEKLMLRPPKEWPTFIHDFPILLRNVLDTYPDYINDERKMMEEYCLSRSEEEWKFEVVDVTEEGITGVDTTGYETEAIGIIKDIATNETIGTLLFDTDNRIRNIRINTVSTRTKQECNFPINR